jgi:hypothetical protein
MDLNAAPVAERGSSYPPNFFTLGMADDIQLYYAGA